MAKINFVDQITIDPFQMALSAVKFGASSLFEKSQVDRARKKNVARMDKELSEGMINLASDVGARASARGLGAGHYSEYLQSTRKIGQGQIDYSKYEAELEDTGYFTDVFRSLTGGRTRSKIAKDLGQSRINIQKLMS